MWHACVSGDNHTAQQAVQQPQALQYARHDVLVPRGADDSVMPGGMGFYNVWNRSLTVAVRGDIGDVAVAGVIFKHASRATNLSMCLLLTQHQDMALQGSELMIGLRLDFLNGSSLPLASMEWLSAAAAAESKELWSGQASVWPPASPVIQQNLLPRLDTATALPVNRLPPEGWPIVDYRRQRFRLSLVVRSKSASSPASITARLLGVDCHEEAAVSY